MNYENAELLDQYIRDMVWSDDAVESVLQQVAPALEVRNYVYQRGSALTECVSRMGPEFHIAPGHEIHTTRGLAGVEGVSVPMNVFREFCAEFTELIAYLSVMIIQKQPGHAAYQHRMGIWRVGLKQHPLHVCLAPYQYQMPQPPPLAPQFRQERRTLDDPRDAIAHPTGQTGGSGSATPKRSSEAGETDDPPCKLQRCQRAPRVPPPPPRPPRPFVPDSSSSQAPSGARAMAGAPPPPPWHGDKRDSMNERHEMNQARDRRNEKD